MTSLSISNPLTHAMSHYTKELAETLERGGVNPTVSARVETVEGLSGPVGKIRMLRRALHNVRVAKHSPATSNIQVWPSLGLVEPLLWRSKRQTNCVVLHDPVPLRRQVGFDPVSKFSAARAKGSSLPTVIVHSTDALDSARSLLPHFTIIQLPHPILSNQATPIAPRGRPRVVVAGQYKPERNLELLAAIGPRLTDIGFVGSIHGRGWPENLPGWEIDNRFLTEAELDRELASASVVLIPYKRYFQSGIAIRALELGTLPISGRNSFVDELLGAESDLILDSLTVDDTLRAIAAASADEAASPQHVYETYRHRVDSAWAKLARSIR